MEEAAVVRRAARDSVRDVEPEELRAGILARIDGASMTPGVLTLVSARRGTGRAEFPDGLVELAAGVQLAYEGLSLTRSLAHDEPWGDGDGDDGDLGIIVADVLVARGFFLLSRTDAAETAIDMARAFGRDQTLRRTADAPERLDANLEVDALRLAVITGLTATGQSLPGDLAAFAADVVERHDGALPAAGALFSPPTDGRLDRLLAAGDDGVRTSVD